MPIKKETPKPSILPPNYRPPVSLPYRVRDVQKWEDVADDVGMDVKALIRFNYNTDNPLYVNYYLEHNVGCIKTFDGINYSFHSATKGIVYYPEVPPITAFGVVLAKEFTLVELGAIKSIGAVAWFRYHLVLNPKIGDPTRFEFRLYQRGKFELKVGSSWVLVNAGFQIPVNASGGTVPMPQYDWVEVGAVDKGKLWQFGHRDQPATANAEVKDIYSPHPDGYLYNLENLATFSFFITIATS